MRYTIITLSLALCLLVSISSEGMAFTSIGNNWRGEYPSSCQTLQDATTSTESCVLCHTGGFNFNAYGQALKDANNNFASIENLDSDGDGRTNIQEIAEDCTFPGDSASVPVAGSSWESVKALYRW